MSWDSYTWADSEREEHEPHPECIYRGALTGCHATDCPAHPHGDPVASAADRALIQVLTPPGEPS